jgi:predicted permease
VRYALRLIARDRWFTAATVFALALGIGVTSTMATLIYCMNFRGLPFRDAHQLVGIGGEPSRAIGGQVPFAVFEAWRSASRSVAAMTAEVDRPINLGDDVHATDQFGGTFLTHEIFEILGERPVLGREFRADDERPGADQVAIIGYRLWADRYGLDPAVIGRTVRANGQPTTVIGVMPEGFAYPIETQVWRPLSALPGMDTPAAAERPVRVVARLADGVTLAQARAELGAVVSTLTTIPEAERTRRTVVMTLNEARVGPTWQPLPMMMMAAVVVVLLIACGHAASLMLARAAARTRELSVRAALGASRVRVVRQLLVESVITALAAGVIGLGIAFVFVRAFANEVTGFGLPYWTRFTFDLPIVGIVAAICLASGIAFGLLPALQMSRANLVEVMNQGGRAGVGAPQSQRLTTAVLVAEVALTTILLSSAGALVRSSDGVYRGDHALKLADLWEFRLSLPPATYRSAEQRAAFYGALNARLASAPGLESAALASAAPFNARESRGIVMDGEALPEGPPPTEPLVAIGDRYFDTLGLTVVRGRGFEALDPAARATAALVNDRFVARFSPGEDAIGRQVLLFNPATPDQLPRRVTIVGIAPTLRQQVANGPSPVVYVPYETQPGAIASVIIRGRPAQFADALRQEVRRLDPDLPLYNLQSLERVSYMSRWVFRITSTVFSIVAVVAIALSALGLYSLTAYAAAQRTQEVGVRVALGARRSQVSWLFLRRALTHASIGLAIGLAGAIAVGTVLQGTLVEVRANSPWMLSGVCAFLVAISIAAALIPARRASRLDPVAALRQE